MARPIEQIPGAEVAQTQGAGEGHVRIQRGNGDADLRGGCMQYGLGVADVGPPAGKRGWHSDRNRLRNRRQLSRGVELRVQRLRVLPCQHRERVLAARNRLLVGRKLGFEAGELGPRGIDIRLAGEAVLVPVLGQVGDLALRGDEFERDRL